MTNKKYTIKEMVEQIFNVDGCLTELLVELCKYKEEWSKKPKTERGTWTSAHDEFIYKYLKDHLK